MKNKIIFRVSIHPINRPLLERLGIYYDSQCDSRSLGKIFAQLVKAGYLKIQSQVETWDEIKTIKFHFQKFLP